MTIQAMPSIKRFFHSTVDVMFSSTNRSSSVRRSQDSRIHEATSSGRFYGR